MNTSRKAQKNPAAMGAAQKRSLHTVLKQHKEKGHSAGHKCGTLIMRDIDLAHPSTGISKVIGRPLYCGVVFIKARLERDSNLISG